MTWMLSVCVIYAAPVTCESGLSDNKVISMTPTSALPRTNYCLIGHLHYLDGLTNLLNPVIFYRSRFIALYTRQSVYFRVVTRKIKHLKPD